MKVIITPNVETVMDKGELFDFVGWKAELKQGKVVIDSKFCLTRFGAYIWARRARRRIEKIAIHMCKPRMERKV